MKKISLVKNCSKLLLAITLITTFSCSTPKNVKYFSDLSDSSKVSEQNAALFTEPIIKPDDILSVTIQTIDPTTAAIANQTTSMPVTGASTPAGQTQVPGYLVDKNGEIELALLGKIKLQGLTTFEARELVQKKASLYFKEPSVQVRFANFKVNVIGEVARPATYTMPNERVTILDAIGLAGDLTIYGKRENVLLIREDGDKKQFIRFNLNSSDIFKSPYYYLKQNDVIYVEPNDAKIATTDAAKTRAITISASILSAILLILLRVIK